MNDTRVRDVDAADLPTLLGWLRPGADTLPAGDGAWLLCERRGRPLACLRLRLAIGLDLPRPWYHVGTVVHAAPPLNLFHRLHTLQLGHDHTGAAELADPAWDPQASLAEQAGALAALLRAALQRLAAQRARAGAQLIVELPGLRDAQGRSPFWQGLGRHFYGDDPQAAARRFGPAWRSHVAALLPRQAVYTSFLPADAQAALAQVDPAARMLLDLLWQEGLRYSHHVTVDDGGPVFAASLDALPALAG